MCRWRIFHREGPATRDTPFASESGLILPLNDLAPFDASATFDKQRHSALVGTDLPVWLRQHRIRLLIVAGVSTGQCFETTARHTSDEGIEVDFVSDSCGLQLMSVCAGSLVAADAGLLAHRRCTTHHEMLADLQRLAPPGTVLANRLLVIDGPVASSAGITACITAGIDLALHLVAHDCGEALAATVAQVMVVYLRRGTDDPQLSPLLAGRQHLHPAVHPVQDAACAQPASS